MREYEYRCVIGRLLAPPSAPVLTPRPGPGACEHVPSHDEGARGEDAFARRCVGLGLFELPPVQDLSAFAERFRQALVRSGEEAVKGDGQIACDLAHSPMLLAGSSRRDGVPAEKAPARKISVRGPSAVPAGRRV